LPGWQIGAGTPISPVSEAVFAAFSKRFPHANDACHIPGQSGVGKANSIV